MQTNQMAKLFSALGDPTRYKILELISRDPELCVSDLAEKCGITPAGASQHLSVLAGVGLLEPIRKGKRMCYELVDQGTNKILLSLIKENV